MLGELFDSRPEFMVSGLAPACDPPLASARKCSATLMSSHLLNSALWIKVAFSDGQVALKEVLLTSFTRDGFLAAAGTISAVQMEGRGSSQV